MRGKEKPAYKDMFSGLKADLVPAEPPKDDEEYVGKTAAIAKNRWVTALTIQHASKPWESFQYKDMEVRSECEPTRFVVGFSDQHERYRVTVTGRALGRIYALVIQGRMEWIRVDPRAEFVEDGEPVITKIEVAEIREKRGQGS